MIRPLIKPESMSSTVTEDSAAAPTIAQCRAAAAACACFNVRRTARLVTQIYDDCLAPVGVSSGQFVILLTLRILEQATMQQLAEAVSLDRSALSRALLPLEKKKLLKIEVGTDRRRREVSLTPAGLRLLGEGAPHWMNAQNRLQGALGDEGFNGLLDTAKVSYDRLTG